MLWLMADDKKDTDFQILIDTCDDQQFNSIIEEVFSQKEFFLYIAFSKQGSNSIVKLIKRIKKEDHAFTLTNILSNKFYAMMTHHEARIVIQQCLNHLRDEPNEVLYGLIIENYSHLAIHEVGYISLIECIDKISGYDRIMLLNRIANIADILSTHLYGSYVVQYVLDLNDNLINDKIIFRLRGEIILLSQTEGGRDVVHKCLASSDFGLVTVVREILSDRIAPYAIARDKFGYYVIQAALVQTRERGFIDLYESLDKALEPYYERLEKLYRSWVM
ncbi:hypothetical protein ACJIZ3_006721 [Penstemon smallii]|uniref:PUM-HD domain-containing protein n=1 Tax=Penstemon smallii TaxID=265156 RepID=A0ABD3S8Q8_9LAMI